jgi:hypothetical protein
LFIVARAVKPSHTPANGAQKQATTQPADAETVRNDANKALAGTVKSTRTDSGVDPKTAKNASESVSKQEISSEESYGKSKSFDMSEAEEDEIAAEEANDQETTPGDNDSTQGASNTGTEDPNNGNSGGDDASVDDADDDGPDDAGIDDGDDGGGGEGD